MPGQRRSQEPDEVGQRAGLFAESIRDGDMDLAWSMLSKETRGMRMGVWATRLNIDMQVAYRAAYDPDHPEAGAPLLAHPAQEVRDPWVRPEQFDAVHLLGPVSYTHLTLPTIYSV